MAGYQIFTDATADMSDSLLGGLPEVTVIPMTVTVGERKYLYGTAGNLITAEFYAVQRRGSFASTSQVNPSTFRSYFEKALNKDLDVLYLCFSSGMSGNYQSAMICTQELRQRYPQRKILCIDTHCASVGEGFLVREALRMQQEGMGIDELSAWIIARRLRVCHWFTVDVFDHLQHGGRVGAASAVVGTMLQIKPLLHVDPEGCLKVMEKPRGRNKAMAAQLAKMEAGWMPELGKLVLIGHGDDPKGADQLRETVQARFPEAEIHIAQIGPVIGAHTGPGMLALIYWGSNR